MRKRERGRNKVLKKREWERSQSYRKHYTHFLVDEIKFPKQGPVYLCRYELQGVHVGPGLGTPTPQ